LSFKITLYSKSLSIHPSLLIVGYPSSLINVSPYGQSQSSFVIKTLDNNWNSFRKKSQYLKEEKLLSFKSYKELRRFACILDALINYSIPIRLDNRRELIILKERVEYLIKRVTPEFYAPKLGLCTSLPDEVILIIGKEIASQSTIDTSSKYKYKTLFIATLSVSALLLIGPLYLTTKTIPTPSSERTILPISNFSIPSSVLHQISIANFSFTTLASIPLLVSNNVTNITKDILNYYHSFCSRITFGRLVARDFS
jgi:hypothetical protein